MTGVQTCALPIYYLHTARSFIDSQIASYTRKKAQLRDLIPDIIKDQNLAEVWESKIEGRSHHIATDSLPSVDLTLKFSTEDIIADAYLFIETHLPDAEEKSGQGESPIFQLSRLWVHFDPDASDHCRYVEYKKEETVTRKRLVCL